MPTNGDLKVWWIPQIPMTAFEVPVASIQEARKLLDVLAEYDLFQLAHRVKPDFANAGGLIVFDGDEWSDWYDDDGDDIDHEKYDEHGWHPRRITTDAGRAALAQLDRKREGEKG